jgi:CBS domain-containing protein
MRRVADAMRPPVIVEPSTTVQQASSRMLDEHAHAAVVVEDGKVCGLATAEQIAAALAEGYDAAETLIGVIAERNPPVATPDEPLAEAHQRMRAEQHPRIPVVGPRREPLGVLEDAEAGDGSDVLHS